MSYIDKLLDDMQLEFRDKYKDDLNKGVIRNFEFNEEFNRILKNAEISSKVQALAPKKMRTFEQSDKSKKTVSSMIVKENGNDAKNGKTGKVKKNEQKEGMYDNRAVITLMSEKLYGKWKVIL